MNSYLFVFFLFGQLLGAEEGEGGIRVGGRRVMDLGSGTGLLGLVCAALGAARVVLTDVPQQLPLLRHVTCTARVCGQ
jgi:methylase of polypeptide subunit release factors